ncbi:MAG: N-acetylmuramoyl-L-alanine amidase [Gemmatimonadaceae bacterium]|nr:N-acetylmuramoyl-L-alanine amidase [Gemmatimonadaceae bacterium]
MLKLRVLPLLALAAACAPASRVSVPGPMPGRPPAPVSPSLPPVPLVTGPVEVKVVYPTPNSVVASRDSNFIFGSIGNGNAALFINGEPVPVWPNGAYLAFLPVPSREMSRYDVVAVLGRDTTRLSHPIRLPPPPDTTARPTPPVQPQPVDTAARYGILVGPTTVSNDTDRVVTGQPSPDPNIVRYFLFPGAVVRTRGTVGNETVVELEPSVKFRVANGQIQEQPLGYVPPPLAIGRDTIIAYTESVDLIVPATGPPAHYVSVDSSRLTVTLFGVTPFAPRTEGSRVIQDPLLRSISIAHGPVRTEYILDLSGPVFGYQALFENGNFVLKMRRLPVIDPAAPLRGLRIAIDPGHPGLAGQSGGATGPTGLLEREAVVPVGLRARDLLVERGAEVLLTRTTAEQAVDLNLRPTMARRANVHALVSIHFNAFPDGVNPFVNNGTSTYSFHAHSARLSQLVHEAMIRNMHLRDLGTRRSNFAVVRPTWFPAVLTEGAFMMLPDQEHAMKTAEYQDAYARSIVEGLEQFFRELGASQSATVLPSKSPAPETAGIVRPRGEARMDARRTKLCNSLEDLVLRRRAGITDAEQAGQCGEVSLRR